MAKEILFDLINSFSYLQLLSLTCALFVFRIYSLIFEFCHYFLYLFLSFQLITLMTGHTGEFLGFCKNWLCFLCYLFVYDRFFWLLMKDE